MLSKLHTQDEKFLVYLQDSQFTHFPNNISVKFPDLSWYKQLNILDQNISATQFFQANLILKWNLNKLHYRRERSLSKLILEKW